MSATGRGRAREPEDYYTTQSWCVRRFLEAWRPPEKGTFYEPGAGNGAIIRAVRSVYPTRGWECIEIREEERETLRAISSGVPTIGDFLKYEQRDLCITAVIGNPPYEFAQEFIEHAMRLFPVAQIAFLLRLAYAASKERAAFMRAHPPDVYVLPDRPSFTGDGGDSADYGWFVFHPVERSAGRFMVLNTTPLAERQLDRGHRVMIEPAQKELFG